MFQRGYRCSEDEIDENFKKCRTKTEQLKLLTTATSELQTFICSWFKGGGGEFTVDKFRLHLIELINTHISIREEKSGQ